MKKLVFSLFFLIFSLFSFSQAAEKAGDTVRNGAGHLVFIFEKEQFYYAIAPENKKIKMETIASLPINKVIDSALLKNNMAPKDLTVIIEGDGVMSDNNFQTLLETLLDKKINQVRIRTSLYE